MNIALVTGASRGIGAATARKLAALGYDVCVHYHTQEQAAQGVVAAIEKAGGKAFPVQANMGVENDILTLFEAIDRRGGTLTALVNNAAINPREGSGAVAEMSWQSIDSTFQVNVVGSFIAAREAIKRMQGQEGKGRGGAVVNVSSEAGKFGGNRMAHYAASKAAINTFTVALAREVAPGIRVNAVSPGVIDTDAQKGITEERRASLNASMPMGRMGTAQEVADTIAWLLSKDASYVSGAVVTVAGGR